MNEKESKKWKRIPSLSLSLSLSFKNCGMEKLPAEVCFKIFKLFDHHTLATSSQVCRRWKALASDNLLWCNLFKERWGADCASFYAPRNSEPWKDVYIVQDRCDRYGLDLKIIREGGSYYLVHQGEIQRYLGCRGEHGNPCERGVVHPQCEERERHGTSVSDSILFFLGDMEAACAGAKRVKKT